MFMTSWARLHGLINYCRYWGKNKITWKVIIGFNLDQQTHQDTNLGTKNLYGKWEYIGGKVWPPIGPEQPACQYNINERLNKQNDERVMKNGWHGCHIHCWVTVNSHFLHGNGCGNWVGVVMDLWSQSDFSNWVSQCVYI